MSTLQGQTAEVLSARPSLARLRDFVALGKPRLSMLVLFTAAIGVFLADGGLGPVRTGLFLLATSCLVAAANTLNCWIEIELDGLMERTRDRPLPAGRLEPREALLAGIVLSVVSLGVLAAVSNLLTTALGLIALVTYALIYTPLKRVTPWALLVGAVPGAMPPLMGWTAAAGHLAVEGWVLFAILFCWQLPHFLAISLYLKDDFRRAGFRVLPLARGDRTARRYLLVYAALLVVVSLGVQPLGLAGSLYTAVAAALGLGFMGLAVLGLKPQMIWAHRIFAYTLIYLPLLITVLVLDAR